MRFERWLTVLQFLNVVCGGVVKAPGDAYSVPDQNIPDAHNVPDQNIQGLYLSAYHSCSYK